jgi:hypothetical protein
MIEPDKGRAAVLEIFLGDRVYDGSRVVPNLPGLLDLPMITWFSGAPGHRHYMRMIAALDTELLLHMITAHDWIIPAKLWTTKPSGAVATNLRESDWSSGLWLGPGHRICLLTTSPPSEPAAALSEIRMAILALG